MMTDLAIDYRRPPAARPGRPARPSRQENVALALRARAGDRSARDQLIDRNRPLAALIAREYEGRGLEPDDLFQLGCLGLIRAAEDYDPARGFAFSTYASYWVRQAIRRGIEQTGREIVIPAYLQGLRSRAARIRGELARSLGRPATDAEVAAAAGVKVKSLALAESRWPGVGPGGAPRVDIADPRPGIPDWAGAGGEDAARLDALLGGLKARARRAVEMRHGLGGGKPATYGQVGRALGVTQERARQIVKIAIADLRAAAALAAAREGGAA
jgi:RNA polymerase primary sigma factor